MEHITVEQLVIATKKYEIFHSVGVAMKHQSNNGDKDTLRVN